MIDPEFDEQVRIVEGASKISEIERSLDMVRKNLKASQIVYIWKNRKRKLQSIYSSENNFNEELFSDPAFLVKLYVNDNGNHRRVSNNAGFSQSSESWISNIHTANKSVEAVHSHTIYVFSLEGNTSAFTFSKMCNEAEWVDSLKRNKMLLTLYARVVAENIFRTSLSDKSPATYRLSIRETDVIASLARGLSRSETAHLLQISEHTIRVHVENAKRKLRAQNTVHAVASAVANGFVPCPD